MQVAIFSLFPANHLRFAYVITITASSNRKLGISNFDSNCLAFCPMILHGKLHDIAATQFEGGNANIVRFSLKCKTNFEKQQNKTPIAVIIDW